MQDERSPPANRFETYSRPIMAAFCAVLILGGIALLEWMLTPKGGRHTSHALSDSPALARHLVMREWKVNTDYVFAPPPERGLFKDAGYSGTYRLSTDADGFIVPAVRHVKPDSEIVFLGGSTTECMYVSPDLRFPHHAAVLLEQTTGLKINGINAGRSGNTTMHAQALLLAKVLPRRPDFVVLMESVNDLGLLLRGGYWQPRGGQRLVEDDRVSVGEGFETIAKSLVPYTFAAILQAKRVLRRQAAPLTPAIEGGSAATGWADPAALLRDYEASLRAFVRTVAAWGAEPVLMTQVRAAARTETERQASFLNRESLGQAGGTGSAEQLHDAFREVVRKVAAEESAILIDLVRGHDWQFGDVYDAIHFTDQGSRKVAELVAAGLADRVAARVARKSATAAPAVPVVRRP